MLLLDLSCSTSMFSNVRRLLRCSWIRSYMQFSTATTFSSELPADSVQAGGSPRDDTSCQRAKKVWIKNSKIVNTLFIYFLYAQMTKSKKHFYLDHFKDNWSIQSQTKYSTMYDTNKHHYSHTNHCTNTTPKTHTKIPTWLMCDRHSWTFRSVQKVLSM